MDDEPVVALKQAPLTAVKPTGEEVEIAQVITPRLRNRKKLRTPRSVLPQNGQSIATFGLIGLLSLGAGLALMGISKRTA